MYKNSIKMTELSPQQLQIIITGIDNLEAQDLLDLVQSFPFKNLVNISLLNYESIRLHLLLLLKFCKIEVFYENSEALKCTLEFTLINLSTLENVCANDILTDLLEVLKLIISKAKTIKEYSHDISRDRERILDIITATVKLKIFGKSHASNCAEILCHLLTLGGPMPLTTSRSVAEISEVFKGLKAVHELAIICNIVLKKFTVSTEVFNVCIPWLLIYGPIYLQEECEDEKTILELLVVMAEFYVKFGFSKSKRKSFKSQLVEAYDAFILNLTQMSSRLIKLANKEKIREASLRLFSFLFFEDESKILCIKETAAFVLNKLLELPLDVKQWPNVGTDMFFHVCCFLMTHSSLVWTPQEILSSMSSLVYSYQRFSIDLDLLKTLCYIYPVIVVDFLNTSSLLLGEELLILMSKWPCSFAKIFTPHIGQLVWILKRGDYDLKMEVLCQWLKREDVDMDVLGKVILHCNIGSILLDIIMDQNADGILRDKAMQLTHKIQDDALSKKITMNIPVVLHNETLLCRLIQSNPGTPDDLEDSFKIVDFMCRVLFLIEDEDAFRAACIFCKHLLTDLKRENEVIHLFCRYIENIRFLVIKVKYVNDETAAEILRLLKVLVLIQKRNHAKIEEKVEAALSQSLFGSPCKIEKCLEFLQIIVTSKNVLIILDESDIQDTFLILLSLSNNPEFSVRSFICLSGILRRYERLASLQSTCLFVEIQCSLQVDAVSGSEFIAFLSTWMKSLKGTPGTDVCYVPNKKSIANYVKRANFISQKKASSLLQILNKLKMYANTTTTTTNKLQCMIRCGLFL